MKSRLFASALVCALLASTSPLIASASVSAVTYVVLPEPSTGIVWNPAHVSLASTKIASQSSSVKNLLSNAKRSGRLFLRLDELASLKQQYPALIAPRRDCNIVFHLSDVASWLRPGCNIRFEDPRSYLQKALAAYLEANPGYNSGEDRLNLVYPLHEIATNKWPYSITDGQFYCPREAAMGTWGATPMFSASSGGIRGYRISVSASNKWKFKVEILPRDLTALAATAKAAPGPWGISFTF